MKQAEIERIKNKYHANNKLKTKMWLYQHEIKQISEQRKYTRNREDFYMMKEESIHQEDTEILKVYTTKNRDSNV